MLAKPLTSLSSSPPVHMITPRQIRRRWRINGGGREREREEEAEAVVLVWARREGGGMLLRGEGMRSGSGTVRLIVQI